MTRIRSIVVISPVLVGQSCSFVGFRNRMLAEYFEKKPLNLEKYFGFAFTYFFTMLDSGEQN